MQQVASQIIPETLQSILDPNSIKNLLQQQQQQKQQQQHEKTASPALITNTDPKLGAVSLDHPEAYQWFYLDPQNQIQGAFSAEQMAGWLAAGYFTLNLMIKRGCDDKFLPLGIVTTNWSRVPFTPGPQPAPLLLTPKPSASPNPNPQQQQQQHTQQQHQSQWTKDQLLQQLQLYQQMQQLQFFPQNFNLLR